MADEIRVQDEQGTIHVFPGEATPEMIAQAMGVKPPAGPGRGGAPPYVPQAQPGPISRAWNWATTPLIPATGNERALPGSYANSVAPNAPPTPMAQDPIAQGIAGMTSPLNLATAAVLAPEAATGTVLKGVQRGVQGGLAVSQGAAAAQDASEGNYGSAALNAGLGALSAHAAMSGLAVRSYPQKAVMPEAAALPDKAIKGAESVFRAAAPTGANEGFRANVYAAAGDLAEVGRNLKLAEAKGGIISPDMRVRATVNALNDHLSEMYQAERLPQIQRNANVNVDVPLSADAGQALQYLARSAGDQADRSLAMKLLSKNGSTTVADLDQMARLANKELLGFESMTPAERATSAAINRRLGGLKALDQSLTKSLNDTLVNNGETGIQDYERRFAALSGIREQLARRTNAVELNQPGYYKGIIRPIIGAVSTGPKGIASASQAAIADVNIGKTLQDGLRDLADSGITPKRSGAEPLIIAPEQSGSSALSPSTQFRNVNPAR